MRLAIIAVTWALGLACPSGPASRGVVAAEVDSAAGNAHAESAPHERPAGDAADAPGNATALQEFRTRHFIVHTDLDESLLRPRLARMEKVLTLASRYWGQRLQGPIECYLVADLDHWRAADLPSPLAMRLLRHVGGGTDLKTVQRSRNPAGRTPVRSVIYATTKPGVMEHEVVHAYCFQTFGHGGPAWYREGMAELFASRVVGKSPESDHHDSLERLRSAPDIRSHAIVTQSLRDGQLWASLARDSVATAPAAWHWTAADAQALEQAHLAYAQSWALCSLLTQHDRYRERFRALGRHWLQGGQGTFDESFGGVQAEIDFELTQFVRHYDHGYRVDLVAWPWLAEPQVLAVGEETTVRVPACHGYQATRVAMNAGQQYKVTVEGTWQLDDVRVSTNGAGVVSGPGPPSDEGRLEAALLRDFQLVQEGPLVVGQAWSPAEAGHLFVRCLEPWHKLGDNRGEVSVRILRVR